MLDSLGRDALVVGWREAVRKSSRVKASHTLHYFIYRRPGGEKIRDFLNVAPPPPSTPFTYSVILRKYAEMDIVSAEIYIFLYNRKEWVEEMRKQILFSTEYFFLLISQTNFFFWEVRRENGAPRTGPLRQGTDFIIILY